MNIARTNLSAPAFFQNANTIRKDHDAASNTDSLASPSIPEKQKTESNQGSSRGFLDNNVKTTVNRALYGTDKPEPASRETEFRDLDWQSDENHFTVLGAFGGVEGGYMRNISAYTHESSTVDNPVFYVEARDNEGEERAYLIELNKIDPANATRVEMLLYTTYLYKNADDVNCSVMQDGIESNFFTEAYEWNVSEYPAPRGEYLRASRMTGERLNYLDTLGKLAQAYSASPLEGHQWLGSQIRAMFAQMEDRDWSKLGDFTEQVSAKNWNDMFERDEEKIKQFSSGSAKKKEELLSEIFVNLGKSAYDNFGSKSSKEMSDAWFEILNKRNAQGASRG